MALDPGSETNWKSRSTNQVETVLQTVTNQLQRGHLLLGLDRDGTLVPIADRPEEAKMDPAVAELVQALSQRGDITVAIVSARSNALLQADLPFNDIIFAGNYGMEIRFADGQAVVQQAASAAVPHLHAVRDKLAEFTAAGVNAVLEDHGYSLCLHWHTVPVERRQQLHDTIKELQDRRPDLQFRSLPTSYEVLPQIEWDKGTALKTIAEHVNEEHRQIRAFIYIGDSDADEPAFAWVNSKKGISVKVASAGGCTVSSCQVPDTKDVRRLLMGLRDLPVDGSRARE